MQAVKNDRLTNRDEVLARNQGWRKLQTYRKTLWYHDDPRFRCQSTSLDIQHVQSIDELTIVPDDRLYYSPPRRKEEKHYLLGCKMCDRLAVTCPMDQAECIYEKDTKTWSVPLVPRPHMRSLVPKTKKFLRPFDFSKFPIEIQRVVTSYMTRESLLTFALCGSKAWDLVDNLGIYRKIAWAIPHSGSLQPAAREMFLRYASASPDSRSFIKWLNLCHQIERLKIHTGEDMRILAEALDKLQSRQTRDSLFGNVKYLSIGYPALKYAIEQRLTVVPGRPVRLGVWLLQMLESKFSPEHVCFMSSSYSKTSIDVNGSTSGVQLIVKDLHRAWSTSLRSVSYHGFDMIPGRSMLCRDVRIYISNGVRVWRHRRENELVMDDWMFEVDPQDARIHRHTIYGVYGRVQILDPSHGTQYSYDGGVDGEEKVVMVERDKYILKLHQDLGPECEGCGYR